MDVNSRKYDLYYKRKQNKTQILAVDLFKYMRYKLFNRLGIRRKSNKNSLLAYVEKCTVLL